MLSKDKNTVYLVDFGLAVKHIAANGVPFEQRSNQRFKGTISYASLNAHDFKVRF